MRAPQEGSVDSVSELIRQLRASHPSVRSAAAEDLGHAGSVAAVPPLLEALRDSDADIRSSSGGNGHNGSIGDSGA